MSVSKRNRRGVVWLLIIGLLISFTPRLYAYFFPSVAGQVNFTALQEKVHELETRETGAFERTEKKKSRYHKPEKAFDPNTYTKQEWIQLGLSAKQADVILRFAEKGIRSNESLKKIFVIPDELFDLIKDSTYYPVVPESIEKNREHKKQVERVDLSFCTKEDLIEIPGIGEYFAKKIIEYRERLGGFYSTEQLKEIWKLDSAKYVSIEPYIFLSQGIPEMININSATVDQLAAHPYINYKVANSLVKLREQHGKYGRIEDIKKSKLINTELYERIYHYLKVN